MTTQREIPGWQSDVRQDPSGAIPGWDSGTPDLGRDPAKRGIAARLTESAQQYRTGGRRIVALALVFQGVFSIPVLVELVLVVRRDVGLWSQILSGHLDATWRSTLVLASGPFHDLALDQALMGVVLGISALGGFLAMAAIALAVVDQPETDRSVLGLARDTISRSRSIFPASIALIGVLGAFYWLQGRWLSGFALSGFGYPGNGRFDVSAAGVAVAFAIVTLIVEFGLFYAVVRWSVAVPALALERLSLRNALRRSSELTKGRRLSILWLFIVAGFALTLVASVLVYGPAIIVVIAGWGFDAMVASIMIGAIATVALGAPYMAILVAILYRDLRDAGPRPRNDVPPVPPGWGSA
ncbi:MAG: hypothetical protein EPO00_06175 [Chloroflexota bacterium]|nr:MAG: hypothetical protein EPO00_06175 [Chloroflexota bacterium]